MHRVYIHASKYREFWVTQYLEEDLRTPVGRFYHYESLDKVRKILDRAHAPAQERDEFEMGVRRWGIGACFIQLTDEQYANLKKG